MKKRINIMNEYILRRSMDINLTTHLKSLFWNDILWSKMQFALKPWQSSFLTHETFTVVLYEAKNTKITSRFSLSNVLKVTTEGQIAYFSMCTEEQFCWLSVLSFFFFFLFKAASVSYRSSQARDQIRAAATGLCHSHSNTGSELHLWPALQLAAMPNS